MKRVYKILLLLLFPLLASLGVGIYSYHRYQNFYYSDYIASAKYKDTEDLIDKYMKFKDTYTQEYIKEDVKNEDDKNLFSLLVVREFYNEDDEDIMKYSFIIYNVDYENVYRTIPGYTDTKEHKFNGYLPAFKMTITDASDEDNNIEGSYAVNPDQSVRFDDYGFSGVGDTNKWQDGTKITTPTVRWVFIDTREYTISESVNIKIVAFDSQYPNEEDGNYFTAYTKDVTNFYTSIKKFDSDNGTYNGEELVEAYNYDIKKAGYNSYVFKKWIWWECLVAFALALVISGSTVIVWTSEENKELKRQEKINEKKNK